MEEWKVIPLPQSKLHLKSALESRGYFFPSFEINERNQEMTVDVGPQAKIRRLIVTGFPNQRLIKSYRKPIKKIMTPNRLDEIQQWIKDQLWKLGYPCSPVTLTAYPDSGNIYIEIPPTEPETLLSVEEEVVPKLFPGVFERYRAFVVGEKFNGHLLDLTSKRIINDGIVQSTRFAIDCTEKGVRAKEYFILGEPRLLKIGIGANNEYYGIIRASWQNVRLGRRGSSLKADVLVSFKNQEFNTEAKWFALRKTSRFHLRPSLNVQREKEKRFESVSSKLRFDASSSWDNQFMRIQTNAGPGVTSQVLFEGLGPSYAHFLSLNADIQIMDHEFEYFQQSPRSGYMFNLSTTFANEHYLSPLSAYMFSLSGEYLYNLKHYVPPLLIFGVRGNLNTTYTPHREGKPQEIPLLFRHFLGGIENLRGFERKELPPTPQGAFTSLYLGFEARSSLGYTEKFQPFIFLDLGLLGQEPMQFEKTLFWSPGIGARYESPFGSFRAHAAHGFISQAGPLDLDKHSHWQVYLSYGQEF